MHDKKSQNCSLVKSMVHGKPSRPQSVNTAIYDVFNWGHDDSLQPQSQTAHNVKTVKSDQNQYINVKQKTQSCHQPLKNNNELNNIYQNNPNAQQNLVNNQYMLGKPKKSLRPHKIKQQLYMYQNVHLKRVLSEDNNSKTQKQQKEKIKRNQTKKLNENDQKDRQIIKIRKQKLKQFKLSTRQLPNSAFTTYYGKPAFQSYGRCNSSANLKTHNVMPHKGQNHPKVKQTYQNALVKGRNLKTQDHLPRKPIQQSIVHKDDKQQSKLVHLPLQKPDLINHVRFSEPKITSDRKQPVPSFQQLKKSFRKPAKQQKIKKKKKTSKSAIEYDDGLKFMNNRDHLLNLIEAKKTRDSRVAYKVTQCYPPKAQAELSRRKTESENDYSQFQRPAGVAYIKSDHAEVVIYRRY